jgi:hypothetical protein
MLSRKQIWRKTPVPGVHRDSFDETANQKDFRNDRREDLQAENAKLLLLSKNSAPKLRSALSSSNLMSMSERAKRPKDTRTLRFSSTVHVCLIHCRADLRHLFGDLYWKSEDYGQFKNEAVHELRLYLTANGITAKEAIFQLYQPQDAEREQWLEKMRKDFQRHEFCETDRESSSTLGDGEVPRSPQDTSDQESSDEDDEDDYDEEIVEGKEDSKAFKFFTGLKTDVELNETTDGDQSHRSINHKVPMKTPSGPAGASNQSMWAVTWHKKDEKK